MQLEGTQSAGRFWLLALYRSIPQRAICFSPEIARILMRKIIMKSSDEV
jgi:hypothetical protein